MKNWFEVDREGLAKLLERRGKSFVLHELIQNAWDTAARTVEVSIKPVEGRPLAEIRVLDDDPNGFADLAHAYTLFAESAKKGDAEKRGRFNIGEKLVLALCVEAEILSTQGGVRFDSKGRTARRARMDRGSSFTGLVRMTREEISEAVESAHRLIPPAGVITRINGNMLSRPTPLAIEEDVVLPTEVSDKEGYLRRTRRVTSVEIHEVRQGEVASIYEMGIPVVETMDRYHYNVLQKVPLSMERDNVTPAYLQELRTIALNTMHECLTVKEATERWVRDAAADENVSKEAVERVMDLRFGSKRVVYDPSDPEGTKIAMSRGYTVIPPRAMSVEEWDNVRRYDAARPAGQVTPSPKPFSAEGRPLDVIDLANWTDAMRRVAEHARTIAKELLGIDLQVRVAREISWPYGATYGAGELTFNLGRLGHKWFEGPWEDIDRLLLHEAAHHTVSDHLSHEFAETIARLGAALAQLAIRKPEIWR